MFTQIFLLNEKKKTNSKLQNFGEITAKLSETFYVVNESNKKKDTHKVVAFIIAVRTGVRFSSCV